MLNPQHTIRIEYCCPCNYLDRVMALQSSLLAAWGPIIKMVEVVPLSWGMFEVFVDGELIFSKWALERHANEGEIAEGVRARLGPELAGYVRPAPVAH